MKLLAIAYKTEKNGEMQRVPEANVTLESGVENDIFGKSNKRQVSVLAKPQWQLACNEIGQQLDWLTRRVNLLIDGISFNKEMVGKYLYIGESVVLEITCETDPCYKMEQSYKGLEAALTPDWRGGVCTKVIKGGKIAENDLVRLGDVDL